METKNKLKFLRKKGFTQTDISEVLQVSQPTVWRWESGKSIPHPKQYKLLTLLYSAAKEFKKTDKFDVVIRSMVILKAGMEDDGMLGIAIRSKFRQRAP